MASTGSASMGGALRWGILLALLALRRIRHLIVFVGSILAVRLIVWLATVDRPRPFGVDLRTSWGGWAMPSRPVAFFAATLVGVLYTLVPVGRWRQLGKWVATGLVVAFALARVYLGVDAPTDALLGAVLGVAVSVVVFRLLVPSEIFPVVYRRGRSAHLDVSGRRGQAIRQALADQLDQRLLRQGDWPALAQLIQHVHEQGHDVAAITRGLLTATPLNDLPAQDLRYRLVAHLALSVDLPRPPVDTPTAKTTTHPGPHRKALASTVAPTRTPPR